MPEFEKKVITAREALAGMKTSELVEIIAIYQARGFYPMHVYEATKRELDHRFPV